MSRLQTLETLFQEQLHPTHLEIIDESQQHRARSQEATHLKIIIASERFQGLLTVKRHQLVYQLLGDEFSKGLHAVTLHLFTPTEWTENATVHPSPKCQGKSHEH